MPDQGGLAAAGQAHDAEDLALVDGEADVMDADDAVMARLDSALPRPSRNAASALSACTPNNFQTLRHSTTVCAAPAGVADGLRDEISDARDSIATTDSRSKP